MNKRYFYALDISAKDKSMIDNFRQRYMENIRPVAKENFHITLCFLGTITTLQSQKINKQLHQLMKTLPAKPPHHWRLESRSIRIFKKPQVLYLAFDNFPDELSVIASALSRTAQSIGIYQEKRQLTPHLTLARKVKELPNIAPFSLAINMRSLSLYESVSTNSGVRYKAIQSWQLPIHNIET